MLKLFKGLLRFIFSLLLLLCVALGGLLGTQSGSRWLLEQIPGLAVEEFSGQLGYQWHARRILWTDPQNQVRLEQVHFAWQPSCLLYLSLCLERISAEQLQLKLAPSETDSPESGPLVLPELPMPLGLHIGEIQLGQVIMDEDTLARHIQLSGQGHTTPGWPIQLKASVELPFPEGSGLSVQTELEGTLQHQIRINLRTQGYLNAQLSGHVVPLDPDLPLSLNLNTQPFKADPSLPDSLTLYGLTLTAAGDGQQGYQLNGSGRLGTGQSVQLLLEALLKLDGVALKQLALNADNNRYLRITGGANWSEALTANTELTWQDFPWQNLYPADTPPVSLKRLNAKLGYQDRNQSYQGQISADLQGPAGPFSLKTPVQGSLTEVSLPQLELVAGQGRIKGAIKLGWAEKIAWLAQLELSALNPSYWVAELPGTLGGTLNTQGELKQDQLQGKAQLALNGRLRNAPTSLQLNAQGQNNRWMVDQLDLRLGDNRIQGQGQYAERLSAQLNLSLNRLAQLWPGLQGQAQGQLNLAGTLNDPQGKLNLKAQGIAYQGQRLRQLDLKAEVAAQQRGSIDLSAKGINAGGTDVGQFNLNGSGSLERHQVSLKLDGPLAKVALALSGGLKGSDWRGQLSSAQIKGYDQDWTLNQAAKIDYVAQRLTLGAHCWRFKDASLCADNQRLTPNTQVRYQLQNFPLDSLARWMPDNMAWQGRLNAKVNLDLPTSGPTGQIQVDANEGRLRWREGKIWHDIAYQSIHLEGRLTPRQAEILADIQAGPLGQLNLQAQIDPRKTSKPIVGSFSLQKLNLGVAKAFIPQIDQLEGQLNGSGRITGTLDKPNISGQLVLSEGKVSGSQLPTTLEQIRIQADIAGDQMQINGGWRSGREGKGSLKGRVAWAPQPEVELLLDAQQLPITVAPYAQLSASSNLRISLLDNLLSVKGNVRIPKGKIQVRELPPSTVSVSSDAVIVGQEPAATSPAPKMNMDILVEVGQERVSFSGFGLQANLAGHMQIGDNLDTRGELQLKDGRYKAYGQNLSIRRARILFTGPLAEPFLDIEAVRRIEADDVTAGLRISGSTRQPRVEIFSEPSMNQSQALSYLVMGHAQGADTGDSNILARAAVSLGVSGTAALTGDIAEKLGIQDFQLDTEGSGTSTNVVASGRLNDRLSVRYGVGVFEQGTTLALRYQLTKQLFLEAASGLSSSLDVFYRKDF